MAAAALHRMNLLIGLLPFPRLSAFPTGFPGGSRVAKLLYRIFNSAGKLILSIQQIEMPVNVMLAMPESRHMAGLALAPPAGQQHMSVAPVTWFAPRVTHMPCRPFCVSVTKGFFR